MPELKEPSSLGDLLKYEAPNRYSREHVTLAGGQILPLGTVVSRDSATGHVVALDPDGVNGEEIAIGVLIHDADASTGDACAIIIARHAVVFDGALVWPEGISDAEKAQALGQLKATGVVPRSASGMAESGDVHSVPGSPESQNPSSPHSQPED